MLILVRHAAPIVTPETPPDRWVLSTVGLDCASSLTSVLPAGAVLVSSGEPKARQTIEPCGPVRTDARFNEIHRVGEPFGDDFRRIRREYVEGADHPGWEPRAEVADRFARGVAEWRAVAGTRSLVVASHGMAMTVWLSAAIGLGDPGGFWSSLRLPDVFVVDPDDRTVNRLESPELRWVS